MLEEHKDEMQENKIIAFPNDTGNDEGKPKPDPENENSQETEKEDDVK